MSNASVVTGSKLEAAEERTKLAASCRAAAFLGWLLVFVCFFSSKHSKMSGLRSDAFWWSPRSTDVVLRRVKLQFWV